MATFEDVVIRITERGAKETANAIGVVGKESEKASGAVAALNRVMYTLSAAFSVRTLVDYTNQFQSLGNQIRIVTKDVKEAASAQDRLFQIANNARVSVGSLTDLFSSLSLSQKETGTSGERLYKVIDTISKTLTLSGATSQAASAGLRQLVQGLQSGRLQGEELRSVLENTRYTAITLAKGLGVPIGALREMGAQGTLTSKAVIDAFLKMSASVDKDFGKTTVTISQALTQLDNAFLRFVGGSAQASGAATLVSTAIQLLANNLDKVILALALATAGWLAYRTAIVAVAAAQWLANAAIAANPIVRLVAIIGGAITLLLAFNTNTEKATTWIKSLGTSAVETFKSVSDGVTGAIGWFTSLNESISSAVTGIGEGFTSTFGGLMEYLGSWVTWFIELFTVTVPGAWNAGVDLIKQYFMDAFTAIRDFVKNIITTIKTYIDSFVQSALSLINSVINAAKSAAAAIASFAGGSSEVSGARAAGGPVSGGKTYLVGENGPELFTPGTSGMIIPNGGIGQELSASNDNPDIGRGQRLLEQSLQTALGPHFASLRDIGNVTNTKLDRLIELGEKTANSTTSLNNTVQSASQSQGSTGTSAINNFGIETGLTAVAGQPVGGGLAPAPVSTPGTSTTAGSSVDQLNYYINKYAKALQDERTGLRAGSQSRVESLYGQIPESIRDEVVRKASERVFGNPTGFEITFRSGGQFTVPGGTGVDSKVIPIRATPGEEVSVRTRKQVREEEASRGSSGDNVFNFYIETTDADSFKRSEKQVVREFARKISSAVRK